jgi:SSS family transporter
VTPAAMHASIDWIDGASIAGYLLCLAAIALYHTRKMKRAEEMFVAGRSMTGWPIAISMYMALFSTNTFLAYTGWVNRPNGTVWIGLQTVGIVLAVPFVVWLYPALFFRLRVISAYEYLSKRFSEPVRVFATLFFVASRVTWMSTMLYSSSLVITMMLGWTAANGHAHGQTWGILLIGGTGVLFALLGGMHAVIWTDVVQFFFLVAGVLLMIVLGAGYSGGLASVVRQGIEHGRLAPPEWFSLTSEVSVSSALLLGFVGMLASSGADQVVMQQYLTAKSEAVAKRALWRNGIFLKPFSLIYPFLGLIIFAYFNRHPEVAALMRVPDDALPVFVMHVLPAGARGLMIIALMSAVLTSIESGMAAVSAAVQIDYTRRRREPLSDRDAVRLARTLLLVFGVLIVGVALAVARLGATNSIMQILNIVMYPFQGVLLGVFLLGLLAPRVNAPGALVGTAAGFLLTISVPLAKLLAGSAGLGPLAPLASVSTFYYGILGTVTTMATGYAASLFFPPPGPEQIRGLTRRRLPDPIS